MPTTDPPVAAAPAAEQPGARFPSVAAAREAHAALVVRPAPPTADEVVAFVGKVRNTGAVLGVRSERTELRDVISYWVNVLYTPPAAYAGSGGARSGGTADVRATGRELTPADTLLAPFDPTAVTALPDSANPFKGLAAFEAKDAARFFGRDDARTQLVERVLAQPIVVVSGPSGSGKSSLVLAGLVPALQAESPPFRPLPVVTPGADPLAALAHATGVTPELTAATLRATPAALRTALDAGPPGPLLLVVDQFEELFTLCESTADQEAFAAAVKGVAGGPRGNRVVLTVRDDYATATLKLAALKALPDAASFVPPSMSLRDLRRAVERPAELAGLKFEDGIVDELVKEVAGEPTALPLLQFALARLWEKREQDRITWRAYRDVGRPREALQRTAEEVYAALPEGIDKDVAKLVFLDLVRPSVGVEQLGPPAPGDPPAGTPDTTGVEVVRKRVRREKLHEHAAPNRVDDVLKRFVDFGLLRQTPGATPNDAQFDVVHEALIRNWDRLAGWVREKREESKEAIRVAALARQWVDSGRSDGYLLTGTALDAAAVHAGVSPDLKALVEASRKKEARDLREKAVVRRIAAVILVTGCVALAVSTVTAWNRWGEADRLAEKATKTADKLSEQNIELDKATKMAKESATALAVKNTALEEATKELAKRNDALALAKDKLAKELEDQKVLIAGLRKEQLFRYELVAVADDPEVRAAFGKNAAGLKLLNALGSPPRDIGRTIPYAPAFLGADTPVPLPALAAHLRPQVAGGGPIDYVHYSLLLNAPRRLMFYAAVNVDRATLKTVPRAGDRYRFDSRVEMAYQSGDELYLENDLDRGLIARRSELTWGPEDNLRAAVDSAFFYTNICPIHSSLNQGPWARLNDWAARSFAEGAEQVTVFKGPVFRDDDSLYRGYRIPRHYWLVAVARPVNGRRLVVNAFLLEHYRADVGKAGPEYVTYPPGAIEPARFRVPLREVERLTHLDFGPLREFDDLPPAKK